MWCRNNGLTIHPDKTEAMIISQKSFIGPLQALKLGDHYVKFVTKSDCLGMTVDNNLNWKAQVERVSKTLSSKLKTLRRMKCLSTSVKESIYFKGLLPSATYGISVWGSCSSGALEPLEKIHRRAAKIIHNISDTTSDVEILNKAKWKSIFYMYTKRLITLTHQAYYENSPDVINKLVSKQERNRNLRDNLKIKLSRPRTEIGRRTFQHRSAILWNSLPETVKRMENKEGFKKKITHYSKTIDSVIFNSTAAVKDKNTKDFIYF